MSTSKRADRVWKRLVESYGSRVAENYGRDIPKPWIDAIEDLTDEQVAYGLRKVIRDTPIHPPALGQFVAACVDMPQANSDTGPSIQAQLCAYATLNLHTRLHPKQFALPWTYLYREWIDENRPKHMQKCAECTGVLIPQWDEEHPAFRFTVADMLADKAGHAKALKSFEPGPLPSAEKRRSWMDASAEYAQKLRGDDGKAA